MPPKGEASNHGIGLGDGGRCESDADVNTLFPRKSAATWPTKPARALVGQWQTDSRDLVRIGRYEWESDIHAALPPARVSA